MVDTEIYKAVVPDSLLVEADGHLLQHLDGTVSKLLCDYVYLVFDVVLTTLTLVRASYDAD